MLAHLIAALLALGAAHAHAGQAVRLAAPQVAPHPDAGRFACLRQRLPGEVTIGTACVAVDHNTRATP